MLVHAHSKFEMVGLRIAHLSHNAFMNKRSYEKKEQMINFFATFSSYSVFIGLISYYTSGNVSFEEGWMKNPITRFYGMEHFIGMLIAIILVTVSENSRKARKL